MRYLAAISIALFGLINANPVTLSNRAVTSTQGLAGNSNGLNGNVGGVYMCKNKDFQGECHYFESHFNECWNFNNDWKNQVSSFGPDRPSDPFFNFNCTLFADAACMGKSATLAWPGTGDLGAGGPLMNNENESWKCQFTDPEAQKVYDSWN